MLRVVHRLGRCIGRGGGRSFGDCIGVLGCFVDVNESLAGCSIGSVGSLAIGTHISKTQISPGAGYSITAAFLGSERLSMLH